MSDESTEIPAGAGEELDENAGRLLAVINLLAEMAMQTLRQGETDAARGFVDCIEALAVKTKGNVGAVETGVFDGVLHQLRIAVVKGPPPAAPEDEEDGGEAGGTKGDGGAGDDDPGGDDSPGASGA